VSLVLNFMDDAQNGLNIVILDACRNNPFSRSFRSASDGLAQVDAPTGTLIAYATAPGRVASDGTGQNGLYTSELLKQMRVAGLSATEMFMRVRAEVMKQTASKQVPWEASSLVGTFYFSGGANSTASNSGTNNAAPGEARFDAAAFEYSYWETIKNSNSADDFKAYLAKYPEGQFVALAKNRISSLDASTKPAESKPAASDSATELAFWDSIKNSTNVEDFRAYLQKYPNGEFAALAKNRISNLESGVREKESAESHLTLSNTLYGQKKYAEAEIEARECVRLAPNQSRCHSQISRTLYGQDRYAEAETEARESIRLDPRNVDGHLSLGASLKGQKRYSEAEESGRNAVQLAPNYAWAHFDLGNFLANQWKFTEAEAEYNQAARLDPSLKARTPYFFKGSYGIRMAIGNFFSQGTLIVSPNSIQFRSDGDNKYPAYSEALECAMFSSAVVDKSVIREITNAKSNEIKMRFNASSASEAARALEAIRAVCKGK
jgi:tetratricopeptide (TPR) repeat protein